MTQKEYKYQVRMIYGLDQKGEDFKELTEVYLEKECYYRDVIKHVNTFYNQYPKARPLAGEESFIGIEYPLEDGSGELDIILAYECIEEEEE